MAQIKEGDVVRLKSGGPNMTVMGRHSWMGEKSDNAPWVCVWMVGKKKESECFDERMLVLVEE